MSITVKNNNENLFFNKFDEFSNFFIEQNNDYLKSNKKGIMDFILESNDTLKVGIGYQDGGFIQYTSYRSPQLYYATINKNTHNNNIRVFYYEQTHYTEIEEKHIIPFYKLLELMELFFNNKIPYFDNNDWIEI